ncbi:MBL fold metallo-hydrolase [Streptomyces sp. S6]
MVADRGLILDPLAEEGLSPGQVTDVVFSHHHPDHALNAALFPADGLLLSPSVRLAATPGHTAEDISTLVETRRRSGRLHAPVVERRRPRPETDGPQEGRARGRCQWLPLQCEAVDHCGVLGRHVWGGCRLRAATKSLWTAAGWCAGTRRGRR